METYFSFTQESPPLRSVSILWKIEPVIDA